VASLGGRRPYAFRSLFAPSSAAIGGIGADFRHLPHLGIDGAGIAIALTAVAAFAGRSALAPIIDRLNQRHASAVTFVWQAAGLAVMLRCPIV
jgi:hypothetical protein